ncbi:sigma-70 family RNA polymerase sigma factor [Kutzneria buriramensis]|uniref:RNA polymerase sigma-70 factor (ECF subfamily) n=1 Tax=Kutzneria buriramensis TaxID=1045776 RepID=A0A3E0HCJ6_9PSEU|nr:sigma-70 family RNA polymerase sigma factor [Kutzneria buriramensis]REH42578.1 RNA polymerase sigma-70 factor (ECF subfamily) [Kutzneria buriramensis]
MSVAPDDLAAAFDTHRTHLLGVAYRITGRFGEAEDAVQEAWLRLAAHPEGIRDLRAWLTTVVGRICLDQLKSAAARHERYVGSWLPEPLVTPVEGGDPLDIVVQDDGVRMAALVVLHTLTPEQRVAFVLHDAFGVPFPEIAETLGCAPATARQHASRARRIVEDADVPPRADLDTQHAVLTEFLAAVAGGDIEQVLRVLHPDVVMVGDGGGRAKTAINVITGRDKVARFFLGLRSMYGPQTLASFRFALVNGDLGLVLPAGHGPDARVSTFVVRDGRLTACYDVANPDKLTHVEFGTPPRT